MISHSQEYADQISDNLANGTSAATILAGSSPRLPHDQIPLLAIITAFQIHMIESPTSIVSDRTDFEMYADMLNTIRRVVNMQIVVKQKKWAEIVLAMIPMMLRGKKPSVAFNHTKKDVLPTDAPPKKIKNSRNNNTPQRSFVTRSSQSRQIKQMKLAMKKAFCGSYLKTGTCSQHKGCWFSHKCPWCGKSHWPYCEHKKDDD